MSKRPRKMVPRLPFLGHLRILVAYAIGFAMAASLWIGIQGVSTSGFSLLLSRALVVRLMGLAFLFYLAVGLIILAFSLATRGRDLTPTAIERRFGFGLSAVSLWLVLVVTFLPLKGSESFVRAGRLSTLQLNVIGVVSIFLGGILIAWIVSVILFHVLTWMRSRLSSHGMRSAAIAAAAAAVLIAVGASGRPGGNVPALTPPEHLQARQFSRVVVVGVDGCDWEKLEPLVAAGRVPTFERLMKSGCYGPLLSIRPLVSPRIWTTIATGKSAEKHGIKGFVNDSGVPVNATMRKAVPVWDIASAYGAVVGVVGWYVTWPADRLNGFLISDRIHSLLRGPVQILHSLTGSSTNSRLEAFGEFDFDPRYKRYPKVEKHYQLNRIVDEPLRWGYLRDQIYGRAALALAPAYEPDLLLVYFRGVDFVQHFFWQYSDPEPFGAVRADHIEAYGDVISNYYVYQDRLLGTLLEALGSDVNVIIVADHGFMPKIETDDTRPQLTGQHDLRGVFIASGPAIRPIGRYEGASILDIAPTVLAIMGLPVPEDMDGRPLIEAIRSDHLRRYPLGSVDSYERTVGRQRTEVGSTMDDGIKERLRSLGYIE